MRAFFFFHIYFTWCENVDISLRRKYILMKVFHNCERNVRNCPSLCVILKVTKWSDWRESFRAKDLIIFLLFEIPRVPRDDAIRKVVNLCHCEEAVADETIHSVSIFVLDWIASSFLLAMTPLLTTLHKLPQPYLLYLPRRTAWVLPIYCRRYVRW